MTPTPPPPARVTFGYIRVSTEEQSREGVSLDAQRAKIRAYCELHGYTLAEIIEDAGLSGKDMERPGVQRLIDLCRNGRAGHVVVYKLDRLTRRTRHLLELVEDEFTGNGVEFHSIMEALDTTTPGGKFTLTILGALAQMEREQIGERTREALRHIKSTGRHVGAPPFGQSMTEAAGILAPVEAEAPTLEIIGRMRRSGKTYRDIAQALNRRGMKTQRGGRWNPGTVHRIHARTLQKGAVLQQTGGKP